MESKSKRKPASSAINGGGGRIIKDGIEVVKNTELINHWDFLDEIEAPMWADLSLCDLTNDETDDLWFDTCHEFHQCSSSKLISTFFHPTNSINIQEPLSPKIPTSVSKSRGKSYKIKKWEQKKVKPTANKQHPVKTLTRKSHVSTESGNRVKPISTNKKIKDNEGPKTSSSCESGLTDNSRPKLSKSNSSSLVKQDREHESSCKSTLTSNLGQTSSQTSGLSTLTKKDQEHENSCKSTLTSNVGQTSSQTSELLLSLRISLRKSCATRPAARVVATGGSQSEGCKSSSSKSSVGSSPLDQGYFGKKTILEDTQNKHKTLNGVSVKEASQPTKNKEKVPNLIKPTALNAGSLYNRNKNSTLASKVTTKGKVQQHTSVGKVLMTRKVNEQNQMINKEIKKVGTLVSIKETASTKTVMCQKAGQPTGHVQKATKQSVAQKNGNKKLIDPKEKTNNRNRDKDTCIPARKVYFR